ncbi:Core trichothecene cluster (CTC) protein 15 [Cladobotryum mycophilum]|uniref:Core trichothecene cluster (CTC) protein 15 n=1 Tax=Cladobotryum mycophilum TaxID=491253 RepID=A0ABR0SJC3_9HYPO
MEQHHVLEDAASSSTMMEELSHLYRGQILTEVAVPFSNYVSTLQNSYSGAADKRYWCEYLRDLSPCLLPQSSAMLPTDGRRLLSAIIELDHPERIAEFCAAHDTTIAILFKSLWAATLHLITNLTDISFGYFVSVRNAPGVTANGAIGLYLSMLIQRVRIHSDSKLSDILQVIGKDYSQALTHQFHSLDALDAPTPSQAFSTLVNHRRHSKEQAKDIGTIAFKEVEASDGMDFDTVFEIDEFNNNLKATLTVYNLRMRVAEPGTVVLPPSALPNTETVVDTENNMHLDDETENSATELFTKLEFNPKQCLFCSVENSTFDDNLAHMSKAHSFAIPCQDYLTVDLETLVGYLHLVIYGYSECILCTTRRSTVEGIQHHMTAKGHCRFNVASDIAEFYEIPALGYYADEELLRLPSGKILSHCTRETRPAASRTARQSIARDLEPTIMPSATPPHESELALTQDNNTTVASSTQLSRLTRGDQQSLAHLATMRYNHCLQQVPDILINQGGKKNTHNLNLRKRETLP